MKKHLFLLLVAAMASIGTARAAITVRLDSESCSSWSTVYLWAWTSEGNLFDAWPGVIVTKNSDGWYSYTFEEHITSVNIIWNNGTDQTVDIDGVTQSTCYSLNGTTGRAIKVEQDDCADIASLSYDYYNDSTAEVIALNKNYSGAIDIPSSVLYNGIQYSVISIGDYAFSGCTGLTNVTIPNSVSSIGAYAFNDCAELTSVTIPSSILSVGICAFNKCLSLSTVMWNAKNCKDFTADDTPFFHRGFVYDYNIQSFTFGEEVEHIPSYLCKSLKKLTSITIPYNVTSIGERAFYGCGITAVTWKAKNCALPTSSGWLGLCPVESFTFENDIPASCCAAMETLTSVSFSSSVTSIGDRAFQSCTSLTSIEIPSSVTSIGRYAFSYCSGLESIVVKSGNTQYDSRDNCNAIIETATNTFIQGCKYSTIPNSVTSIGDNAFGFCSGLTSIEIPNSVTSIGNYAFNNCTGLTSVEIGRGVTSIGAQAFWECTSLTSIEIPNSVTSIGYYAFQYCTSLTNPVYNEHVFAYLPPSYSGEYTLPDGIELFVGGAFNDCSRLSITIPNSYTSIYNGMFYGCTSLASITIPNSVTSIGDSAFYGCYGLTSITIPNSVTSIGDYAFYGCYGLTSITCTAVIPPTFGGYYDVFLNVDKTIPLYVPFTSVDLYKETDVWNEFTNILPISAEETEITDTITIVTPASTSVDFVWPQVDNAYTYELVIKDKDGNIVCTLTFNAQGQLTSIAFNAPARGDAPQKTQIAGFAFTVTGLDSGKAYDYTLTAKNEGGTIINTQSGSFITKSPQGIDDIEADSKSTKVLRDGQVFIQKGEKTFTITGQEVK